MRYIRWILWSLILPVYGAHAGECTAPVEVGNKTPNTKINTIGLVISNPDRFIEVSPPAKADLPQVSLKPPQKHKVYELFTDCYEKVVDSVLSRDDGRSVVLFVHGRGQHPAKLVKRKLIESIEREYNAHVIAFTWPSWTGMGGFPSDGAQAAAKALSQVINAIADRRTDNGPRRVVMLTHSMGAIVVEHLVKSELAVQQNSIDALMISAAASEYSEHGAWVDAIKFSKDVYIVFNQDDKVLRCLESDTGMSPAGFFFGCYRFDLPQRLGRWGNKADKSVQDIAKQAEYVDLTHQVGDTHRYYIGQSGRSDSTFNWFNNIINLQVTKNR